MVGQKLKENGQKLDTEYLKSPSSFVSSSFGDSCMESDDDSYESGPVGEVAVDTVARLGQRIMAIILGNLCTLAICLLFYLNYVLFESYLLVFLYAFLASEALWDTKQNLVTWLREMSDPDRPISIREEINNRFMSVNRNNSNRTQSWVEVSSLYK